MVITKRTIAERRDGFSLVEAKKRCVSKGGKT